MEDEGTGCLMTVKLCDSRNSATKVPTAVSLPETEGIWTMSRWNERNGEASMMSDAVEARDKRVCGEAAEATPTAARREMGDFMVSRWLRVSGKG